LDEDKDDCNCRIFFPAEAALMHDKTVGNYLDLDKQRNIDILLTMLGLNSKIIFHCN
jgi:hypothetical protein